MWLNKQCGQLSSFNMAGYLFDGFIFVLGLKGITKDY